MRRGALLVILLAAAAARGGVEDLLDKARHAQLVQADPDAAIKLYREALADKSLTAARQATVHLRIALCYVATQQPEKAKGHLAKHLFEDEGVPAAVRIRATELREKIREAEPKPAPKPAPRTEDQEKLQKTKLLEAKQRARRYLSTGDLAKASYHIQAALEIAPEDDGVQALAAELETRLSGVMDFLKEPLRFVSRWTASRTRAVASAAQSQLRKALAHADKREFNLARKFFREAVDTIDACELAADSDELIELRDAVIERWRELPPAFGPRNVGPATTRRSSLVNEYLNHLQRMLDLVSSPEREYRIVRVRARRPGKETRLRVVPRRYSLFDHLPSRWTTAHFASLYLRRRVAPDSWKQPGNYLEDAGGMLITRNRPRVLDNLQKAVAGIEKPPIARLKGRFLLVSVPREVLDAFAKHFGPWTMSDRGESPIRYRVLRASFSLDHIGGFLREEGVEVRLDHDLFDVPLANGAAQTLFIAVPVSGKPPPEGAPVTSTHYGVYLDTFPLRDSDGSTALAMKVAAKHPAGQSEPARFLRQSGELFVDLPPGATLAIGGLVDPFAAAKQEPGRELLLLWQNGGRPAGTAAEQADPTISGVQIPLRNLLVEVRDHPGPKVDKQRGFVRRERLGILYDRARFLERLLREALGTDDVKVDEEDAVARIPPLLRERGEALVKQLERESARSYVVRIHTRAVRTRVVERWLKIESLQLKPFGTAWAAVRSDATGAAVLRRIAEYDKEDIFAPADAWPAVTVRGLQAKYAMTSRRRTSPVYENADDIASAETRMIEEGTRVSVRPYAWGNRVRLAIDVELAGLQSEVEERALAQAVPSYRTELGGTRVTGEIELGDANKTATLVLCRIPHPTASSTEALKEIVIAVSVRALP